MVVYWRMSGVLVDHAGVQESRNGIRQALKILFQNALYLHQDFMLAHTYLAVLFGSCFMVGYIMSIKFDIH